MDKGEIQRFGADGEGVGRLPCEKDKVRLGSGYDLGGSCLNLWEEKGWLAG